MKLFKSFLIIAASIGLFFIYVKPAYEEVKISRQQISEYDDAIERAKNVVATRDKLSSLRQSFSSKDINRLNTFMPDTEDGVKLAIEVNKIALQYTQGIKNVRISEKDSQKASEGSPASANLAYKPVTVSFNISLSYEQFVKFLVDLENSLHLIDVTSLTFTPPQDSALYDFSMTLSTYVLK